MNISVVIPNHNRADALTLTLEALDQQEYPAEKFEVIVVDQASTDGSRELIRDYISRFHLHLEKQESKYGPSAARNRGAEIAKGEIILFLDSDIIADPGVIEAHAALHKNKDQPILGVGRVLPYLPAYRTFVEKAANPEAGLDRGIEWEDFPFYWVFSGHISITRQGFEEIGGFNTELTAFEDIEFGYKAMLKDFRIKNCRNAIGYHNHPRTIKERCEQVRMHNRMLPKLYEKYPKIKGMIPGTLTFDAIRWGDDSAQMLTNKALTRFYSLAMTQWYFYRACIFLDAWPISSKAAKFFYYRLIHGCGYLGFIEGKSNEL